MKCWKLAIGRKVTWGWGRGAFTESGEGLKPSKLNLMYTRECQSMSTHERDNWKKGGESHLNTRKPRLPGGALSTLALLFQLTDKEAQEADLKQPPKQLDSQITRRLLFS